MKNKEENLIGQHVTLYLDGGWEVTGSVESVSDKKIVIEQGGTKDLLLVFREKVSCLKVRTGMATEPSVKPKSTTDFPDKDFLEFPMNKIAYDDTGMTIPQGLLNNPPDSDDDDFAVSFGGESEEDGGNNNGGIEFRINDDSQKED